jgi:hypothetical protein
VAPGVAVPSAVNGRMTFARLAGEVTTSSLRISRLTLELADATSWRLTAPADPLGDGALGSISKTRRRISILGVLLDSYVQVRRVSGLSNDEDIDSRPYIVFPDTVEWVDGFAGRVVGSAARMPTKRRRVACGFTIRTQ